jgi:hypothetical protein
MNFSSRTVTPAVAEAILNTVWRNGEFKSIDDVKKVPGLEAAKIDARQGPMCGLLAGDDRLPRVTASQASRAYARPGFRAR